MDNKAISQLRLELDQLDDTIVSSLLQRIQLAEKIIQEKGKRNFPVEDLSREQAILMRLQEQMPQKYKPLIENIYLLLFSVVKRG